MRGARRGKGLPTFPLRIYLYANLRTDRCPARGRQTPERLHAKHGGGGITLSELTVWLRDNGTLLSNLNEQQIQELNPNDPRLDGFITKHFRDKEEEYWDAEFEF